MTSSSRRLRQKPVKVSFRNHLQVWTVWWLYFWTILFANGCWNWYLLVISIAFGSVTSLNWCASKLAVFTFFSKRQREFMPNFVFRVQKKALVYYNLQWKTLQWTFKYLCQFSNLENLVSASLYVKQCITMDYSPFTDEFAGPLRFFLFLFLALARIDINGG